MRFGVVLGVALLAFGCRASGEKPEPPEGAAKGSPAPAVVVAPTYEVGGDVLPPVAETRTTPELPKGIHVKDPGPILLNAVIDERGRLGNVRIVRDSDPPLARYFADETPHWRFRPATLHGVPVRVYYTIRISLQEK
jgi:hypothetical protein